MTIEEKKIPVTPPLAKKVPNQGHGDVVALQHNQETPVTPALPPEFGGRKNAPEATRYGDWELNGKCVDF